VNALSNPESEKVVLGLCLQDAERLYEATSGIKPEDFSLDSHRKIFSCMADMAATGKSVDYMTVANELGSKRELGSVGGAAYLSSLTEGCVGSLSYHLRVLRDKARRRLLVTACNRGLSAAEDITAETTACISAVEEALLQIEAESGGKNDFHISEFLPDVLEQLQAKAAGNDHYGFSTGIADLDHSLGLLRPGELVVVGALPSRGKTAISLQILGANAINNIPVKDFSLEMTRNQIGNRLLAAHSTISANRIRRPELIGDEGWPMLLKATEQLIEWPLYVDDSASLTLQELTSRAQAVGETQRGKAGSRGLSPLSPIQGTRFTREGWQCC
jgi:replicative DNA helicase